MSSARVSVEYTDTGFESGGANASRLALAGGIKLCGH